MFIERAVEKEYSTRSGYAAASGVNQIIRMLAINILLLTEQ